jgi:hypothetical protein
MPMNGQRVTVRLKEPLPVSSFTGVINRENGELSFTEVVLEVEPDNVEAYFKPLDAFIPNDEG